jgi:hypothetical protein
MLAGVPLARAVAAVGHKQSTSALELKRAARALGLATGYVHSLRHPSHALTRLEGVTGIAGIEEVGGSRWGHWVVVSHGRVLDPDQQFNLAVLPLAEALMLLHLRGLQVVGFFRALC